MLRCSRFCYLTICATIFCLVLSVCSLAADTDKPGAEGLMPDPDAVIRRILGVDEMAKNVCLIDSHQMVNAADLPGRLIAISTDRQVPSDLLRYSFRKTGAKAAAQVNPLTMPIQVTRIESAQARSGSLFKWFGTSMANEDIAEIRTVPLPATSISVDDLDEQKITDRFSTVSADVRRGLGIITDVIPYEVLASVCKKTTKKAESGIWYIQLGKDTYAKQSDELRKYYLVAIYTPILFYDDIGVISGTKSTSTAWLPEAPAKNREEAFNLWLKEKTVFPKAGMFSEEREVGLGDPADPIAPKPEGTEQSGSGDIKTQDDKPKTTGGITTVMPN